MAADTPLAWRTLVFYSVYARNHGPGGGFADVEADLPRLRGIGVDVVWLMPIHPIGAVARKGTLGSPYAIADYRAVNPEYGTLDDLRRLLDRAHALGLRVMLDVVYNHAAPDSRLVREHPDWFHQDAEGRPVTTVPEWSDVIDLRQPNPALSAYLIESLCYWAGQGVDGFRCDVAPLLPIEFWEAARRAVAAVRPGVIWLAESVHAAWVAERRAAGLRALSDGELYRAFDLTYDYDIFPLWQAAVRGLVPVARYLEALRFQDGIYPANFIKLRCVENHDNARIMALAPSRDRALAWTAFAAFNRGAFLIYAGQESAAAHTPSLFERDPIAWGDYELQPFLTALAGLKHDPAQAEGHFSLLAAEPLIQATWYRPGGSLYGLFNVAGAAGEAELRLPDGRYDDLLGGAPVVVRQGRAALPARAAILRYAAEIDSTSLHSEPLDYRIASA